MVTFFDESRVSTLFVFFVCIIGIVCIIDVNGDSLYRFTGLRTQHSFSVTFYYPPSVLTIFDSAANKRRHLFPLGIIPLRQLN